MVDWVLRENIFLRSTSGYYFNGCKRRYLGLYRVYYLWLGYHLKSCTYTDSIILIELLTKVEENNGENIALKINSIYESI